MIYLIRFGNMATKYKGYLGLFISYNTPHWIPSNSSLSLLQTNPIWIQSKPKPCHGFETRFCHWPRCCWPRLMPTIRRTCSWTANIRTTLRCSPKRISPWIRHRMSFCITPWSVAKRRRSRRQRICHHWSSSSAAMDSSVCDRISARMATTVSSCPRYRWADTERKRER